MSDDLTDVQKRTQNWKARRAGHEAPYPEVERKTEPEPKPDYSEFANIPGLIPTEDDTRIAGKSDAAQAVTDAYDSLTIRDVFVKLGGKIGRRTGDDTIQVWCLFHNDGKNPDATLYLKDDKYHCWHEQDRQQSKAGLYARTRGLDDNPENFFEIQKAMAKEFSGVDYAALHSAEQDYPAKSEPQSSVPGGSNASDTDDSDAPDPYETAVEREKRKQLIWLDARDRARREREAADFTFPESLDDLDQELAEPDPEIEWTIQDLHGVGANTTITAGFKVGKTTFMMNLIKALADQESFLGEHTVRLLAGRIAFWNFEVDAAVMKRNFRDMGIQHPKNIWHLPLRGRRMDLLEDGTAELAIQQLRKREIEVWILDPWSGVYNGDENSNSEINALTKRLDQIKFEAGVKDLFVPVHTGRFVEVGKERARGGAKLDDWVDQRWVLARNEGTPDRYFGAEGRRVDQPERELFYQKENNSITYSGFTGTRKEKGSHEVKQKVLDFITANPGCGSRDIQGAGLGKKDNVEAVRKKLIADFDVETRRGNRGKTCHYLQGTAPVMP